MSGQLVDDVVEDSTLNELEAFEQEQAVQEAPPQEEQLPEKLRNKTAQELARMYQEAEKLLGRQAQEVGEIRKLADQLILEKLQSQKQPEPAAPQPTNELTDVDFFANPVEAVKKAVESHPAVLQGREAAARLQQQESLNRLTSTHPDYKELIADPDFKEWVGKSKVRQQLFMQAHKHFDVDFADELFTTYKEVRNKRTEVVNEGAQALKQNTEKALKTVSVAPSGTGLSSKKVYRRADLINLQIKDPDRYMQLQDEIMAAYAEGRVK